MKFEGVFFTGCSEMSTNMLPILEVLILEMLNAEHVTLNEGYNADYRKVILPTYIAGCFTIVLNGVMHNCHGFIYFGNRFNIVDEVLRVSVYKNYRYETVEILPVENLDLKRDGIYMYGLRKQITIH